MGLVKAAMNAASGVMADQWKEFFYCDALPAEVLAVKGQKRTDRRSANKHGNENLISDGSIVAVAEGGVCHPEPTVAVVSSNALDRVTHILDVLK